MTEAVKKPDIVKIAKNRRHIKIVEDLQQGKTLTPAEIRELAIYETEDDSQDTVLWVSQVQVAKLFKVDTRTVRNWIDAGMPVAKKGKYNLAEIVAWKMMREKPSSADAAGWIAKWHEARACITGYKAELEEMKVKEFKGALISRGEVERGLVQVSIAIKQALLALPRAIAPRLIGLEAREIETVLRERVEEIINLFAKGQIFGSPSKRVKKYHRKAGDMDR